MHREVWRVMSIIQNVDVSISEELIFTRLYGHVFGIIQVHVIMMFVCRGLALFSECG